MGKRVVAGVTLEDEKSYTADEVAGMLEKQDGNWREASGRHKAKLEETEGRAKQLEADLTAKTAELASAQQGSARAKQLEAEIAELRPRLESAEKTAARERLENAARVELLKLGAGAAVEDALKLADLSGVKPKADGKGYEGIETAVAAVKERLPAIFGAVGSAGAHFGGGGGAAGTITKSALASKTTAQREAVYKDINEGKIAVIDG